MSTRVITTISILTDYIQAQEDGYATTLLSQGQGPGGGTSAVIQSLGKLSHRLSVTGFGTGVSEPEIATSGGFDSTVANSIIGISVNGGSSASWTVQLVQAELENLN